MATTRSEKLDVKICLNICFNEYYAHMLTVVTLIVVKQFCFLDIARYQDLRLRRHQVEIGIHRPPGPFFRHQGP